MLLRGDRAAVDGVVQPVDGAAGDRVAHVDRPADGVAAAVAGQERRVIADRAEPRLEPGLAPDEVVAVRANDQIDAPGQELGAQLAGLEPGDAGLLGGVAQPVGEEPIGAPRRRADLDDLVAGLADPSNTAAPKAFCPAR